MLEHPNIQYNSKQRQASLLAQLRQKGHLIRKDYITVITAFTISFCTVHFELVLSHIYFIILMRMPYNFFSLVCLFFWGYFFFKMTLHTAFF